MCSFFCLHISFIFSCLNTTVNSLVFKIIYSMNHSTKILVLEMHIFFQYKKFKGCLWDKTMFLEDKGGLPCKQPWGSKTLDSNEELLFRAYQCSLKIFVWMTRLSEAIKINASDSWHSLKILCLKSLSRWDWKFCVGYSVSRSGLCYSQSNVSLDNSEY